MQKLLSRIRDFVGKGEDVVPARPLPHEMRAARVKEGKRGTL